MGAGKLTYKPARGFWSQTPDHQIAYAAHGVKALMDKRAANPIVREAQYALMRAMRDPVEKFDWGTWFTKNHYKPDAVEKSNPEGINQYSMGGHAQLSEHLRTAHRFNVNPGKNAKLDRWMKVWTNVHQQRHESPDLGANHTHEWTKKQASLASTGAFMALLPAVQDAHLLASQEERPEDLHCTLAYFGKAVDLDQQTKRLIVQCAQKWAGQNPFASTLSGKELFGSAYVVTVLDPRLVVEREALVAGLTAAGVPIDNTFPDYKPHVTLSYHDDLTGAITTEGSTWTGGSITFDRVLVAFGDVQYVIPLMIRKALPDDVVGSIDPVIDLYKKKSKAKIDQAVHDLHEAAQSHMVAQLNTPFDAADVKAGIDASFEKYGSKIADTSADDLRGLLEDVLDSGPGNPADFSKALRYGWDEFTKDKADQIAWTEYNNVASQATLSSYRSNGVEYKAWLTVGDANVCEECQTNEDEGPIPIDQEFPSGDDAPPQHPDCRCNVTSVVSPDTALEGDFTAKYDDSEPRDERGRWTAGEFYAYQDKTMEHLPKMMKQRDIGKTLEDAMDIGRGLDTQAVGYYTEEKIGRVDQWLNSPGESELARNYRVDRLMKPMGPEDRAHAAAIADGYRAYTGHLPPAGEAVRQLTIALTRQDLPAARLALAAVKTHAGYVDPVKKYSDDEARDDHGRWAADGGAAEPKFVDQNTVPRQTKLGPVDFQESGDAMGQEYHATYHAFPVNAPNGASSLGYISVAYDRGGKNAYIKMIEVPEQNRRMGVATALLDRVKAEGAKIKMLGNFATPEGQAWMQSTGIKPPAPPSRLDRAIRQLRKDLGGGGVSTAGSQVLTTGDLNAGGRLAPQQGLQPKRRKGKPGYAAPEPEHRVDDAYWELAVDPITGKYRASKAQDLPD